MFFFLSKKKTIAKLWTALQQFHPTVNGEEKIFFLRNSKYSKKLTTSHQNSLKENPQSEFLPTAMHCGYGEIKTQHKINTISTKCQKPRGSVTQTKIKQCCIMYVQ